MSTQKEINMARENQVEEVDMGAVETLSKHRLSRRELLKYAGIGVGALSVPGVTYPLVQYHFHVPSEQRINGRAADLEAHFVHTTSSGESAVLGVLYNVGSAPNELLDHMILSAPAVAGQTLTGGEANPADLLPDNFTGTGDYHVGNFYTYAGSLTTPGCTEGVRWVVMRNGGHVSQAAVSRFHRAISHFPNYAGYASNTRPVQPLNGRTIGFSDMGNG
jgi:carbonic anhydrase